MAGWIVKVRLPLLAGLQSVQEGAVVAIDSRAQKEDGHHEVEGSQAWRLPPCLVRHVQHRRLGLLDGGGRLFLH